MGDLPKEKRKSGLILWVTYPRGGMASFLWVTYPDKKKRWRMVSFLWVTYPEKMMVSL